MRLGGLEAGGTKMVMCVGNENGEIFTQMSIPTKTPAETVPEIVRWFSDKNIDALGIGCFGPIDVSPDSPTYGQILETPKLPWVHYDLLKELQKELKVPMKVDTDVNGSCLGEIVFGCAKGIDSVLYITIGTGVGVGICIGGNLVHGMLHPEAGHIIINKHKEDKGNCICPYHDSCFEGLAAGPSIETRWGKKAYDLADNDLAWEIESEYIAQALVNYILTVSPKKIILGGGVMHQERLFPMVRKKVTKMLNGYLNTKELKDMDNYIVPNSLSDNQGILGAIEIGRQALEEAN